MKSCSARLKNGLEMPRTGCPGKKLHACDQCAGTKKACDAGWPCPGCVVKARACTYERLGFREDNSPDSLDLGFEIVGDTEDIALEPAGQVVTHEFAEWAISTPNLFSGLNWDPNTLAYGGMIPQFNFQNQMNLSVPARQPLRFLLNVVKDDGIDSVFNLDRSWRYDESQSEYGYKGGETVLHDSQFTVDNWFLSTGGSEDLPLVNSGLQRSARTYDDFDITHMVRWLEDPLFSQSKGIWELFRGARDRPSRGLAEHASAEDGRILEFFSPVKLGRFLDLFWAGWYPHCPIIHKPTFDVSEASCSLVASMAMIGACMALGEDRVEAKLFLDTLEAVVFENGLFQDECLDGQSDELLLQILQAGHFVCVLQNWEGEDKGKKRARQQRFTSLVAVSLSISIPFLILTKLFQAARLIGLSRARHSWEKYFSYSRPFYWREFYTTESLIRYEALACGSGVH
jgi:hypothetical protein